MSRGAFGNSGRTRRAGCESFTGQFSLAGAQAKTALLFKDGDWGVPSGSTPTTHILKPAVAGFDDHDLSTSASMRPVVLGWSPLVGPEFGATFA